MSRHYDLASGQWIDDAMFDDPRTVTPATPGQLNNPNISVGNWSDNRSITPAAPSPIPSLQTLSAIPSAPPQKTGGFLSGLTNFVTGAGKLVGEQIGGNIAGIVSANRSSKQYDQSSDLYNQATQAFQRGDKATGQILKNQADSIKAGATSSAQSSQELKTGVGQSAAGVGLLGASLLGTKGMGVAGLPSSAGSAAVRAGVGATAGAALTPLGNYAATGTPSLQGIGTNALIGGGLGTFFPVERAVPNREAPVDTPAPTVEPVRTTVSSPSPSIPPVRVATPGEAASTIRTDVPSNTPQIPASIPRNANEAKFSQAFGASPEVIRTPVEPTAPPVEVHASQAPWLKSNEVRDINSGDSVISGIKPDPGTPGEIKNAALSGNLPNAGETPAQYTQRTVKEGLTGTRTESDVKTQRESAPSTAVAPEEPIMVTKQNARLAGEAGARGMSGAADRVSRWDRITQGYLSKSEKTTQDRDIIEHSLDTGDTSRLKETTNPRAAQKAFDAHQQLTKLGAELRTEAGHNFQLKQNYMYRAIDRSTPEKAVAADKLTRTYSESNPSFAQHRQTNIRNLRQTYGATQEDLAKTSGLSVKRIDELETGKAFPTSEEFSKLSEALHSNVEELSQIPIGELRAAGVLKHDTVGAAVHEYANRLKSVYGKEGFIREANKVLPQAAIDTNLKKTGQYHVISGKSSTIGVHPDVYKYSKDVQQLNRDFTSEKGGIFRKGMRKAGDVVTKLIVLNPAIHGANQLWQATIASGNTKLFGNVQAGPIGAGKMFLNLARGSEKDAATGLTQHEAWTQRMIKAGHTPSDYGTSKSTYVRQAFKALGMEKANLGRDSSLIMKGMDERLQTSLFRTSVESGMSDVESARNLERFMSDRKAVDNATGMFTIFWHYLGTMTKALYSQARHPVANAGANVNTVLLLALGLGLNKAYQEFTGNDKAHVRMPGELGVAEQAIKSFGDVTHKTGGKWDPRPPRILTNHINPIIKEAAQQGLNRDLFTGKPVRDPNSPDSPLSQAVHHAEGTLVSPLGQMQQADQGGRSLAEALAGQFGLYTTHARGFQAAPNVPLLNVPGAAEGTGAQQSADAKAWYDRVATAKNSVVVQPASDSYDDIQAAKKSTAENQAAIDTYINRMAAGGDMAWNKQAMAELLLKNPQIWNALRTAYKADPSQGESNNPMWSLTDSQLKEVLLVRHEDPHAFGLGAPSDVAQKYGIDNAPWYKQYVKDEQSYFDSLPADVRTKIQSQQSQDSFPDLPQPAGPLKQQIDTYNALTGQSQKDYLKANPGISQYFGQVSIAKENQRAAMGLLPDVTPKQAADLNEYNRLKDTGQNTGAFMKAHPELSGYFAAQGGISGQAKILEGNQPIGTDRYGKVIFAGDTKTASGGGFSGGRRSSRRGSGRGSKPPKIRGIPNPAKFGKVHFGRVTSGKFPGAPKLGGKVSIAPFAATGIGLPKSGIKVTKVV